jgi:murein DD-endopeptidase MepM/ murein hydrolase activator NlpD
VDFQRDIQPGDQFDIVFENLYTEDGQVARKGDVIFSSLTLGDQHFNIYRHTTIDGKTDYFNENGFSVRKELLRTPLNVAHITSGFGVRRHPVLGYTKMHKGIDFSASTGTPIFAAGNGIIEEIGRKGTYGNYVRIKHNATFSTAYAHASRFAKELHKGDRVAQGDVIAYVGSTGRATGPHLHYEVMIDNKQINPLSVKVSPGLKLAGMELDRFKQYKQRLETLLARTPNQTELAFDSRNGLKKVN